MLAETSLPLSSPLLQQLTTQPTEVEPSPFSSSSPPSFSQDSFMYRPFNLEIPPTTQLLLHRPLHHIHTHTHKHKHTLCCTVILYICPLATEHCGYCILLFFFFSCHLCMMSVLYFVDATTTFCGPLGTIKDSILFYFYLSSLCFLTVSPLLSDCLLVSHFTFSSYPLIVGCCV